LYLRGSTGAVEARVSSPADRARFTLIAGGSWRQGDFAEPGSPVAAPAEALRDGRNRPVPRDQFFGFCFFARPVCEIGSCAATLKNPWRDGSSRPDRIGKERPYRHILRLRSRSKHLGRGPTTATVCCDGPMDGTFRAKRDSLMATRRLHLRLSPRHQAPDDPPGVRLRPPFRSRSSEERALRLGREGRGPSTGARLGGESGRSSKPPTSPQSPRRESVTADGSPRWKLLSVLQGEAG